MRAVVLRSTTSLLRRVGCPPPPAGLGSALRARLGETGPALRLLPDVGPATWRDAVGTLADEVSEQVAGQSAEVVHALDPVAAAAALSARSGTGVPVVVRFPDTATDRRSQVLGAVVLRGADVVAASTERDARRAHRLGVDRSRVVVCPDVALLAADVAGDGGDPVAGRDDVPYVLGMSGVPSSPRVRASLLRCLVAQPQARLVIASPDDADLPLRHELEAEAAGCGVLDRVSAIGTVDRARLVELVDGARVVVGSRAAPTSSLAALVAMNRCRPVVSVRSPSADEVLVDGVTGYLVGDGDDLCGHLSHLVRDAFSAVALGVAGQDRAHARYGAAQVTETLLDCYGRAGSLTA